MLTSQEFAIKMVHFKFPAAITMASQGDQSKTGSQYADSARWQATRSNENRRDGYHWSTLAKPSGMHCLGNCMAMVSILNADDETLAQEAVGKASNDSTASEHPMLLQGCVVSCHMQPLNSLFTLSDRRPTCNTWSHHAAKNTIRLQDTPRDDHHLFSCCKVC